MQSVLLTAEPGMQDKEELASTDETPGDLCKTGVCMGGWTITARKAPIAGEVDIEALKTQISAPALPEQLFLSNSLLLEHRLSGLCVHFNIVNALHGWLNDRSLLIEVEEARTWQLHRSEEISFHNAKLLNYDWTFTTNYQGGVTGPNDLWEVANEPPDRSLLHCRDKIHYWVEVPLYESELEDHGISQLQVKVRVMQSCWLVLLRFFLRVDGVAVRLRETRYFTRWDDHPQAGTLFKETKYHQDNAAGALQAVAPRGVVHFSLMALRT